VQERIAADPSLRTETRGRPRLVDRSKLENDFLDGVFRRHRFAADPAGQIIGVASMVIPWHREFMREIRRVVGT
jgi:hypothetical protein